MYVSLDNLQTGKELFAFSLRFSFVNAHYPLTNLNFSKFVAFVNHFIPVVGTAVVR